MWTFVPFTTLMRPLLTQCRTLWDREWVIWRRWAAAWFDMARTLLWRCFAHDRVLVQKKSKDSCFPKGLTYTRDVFLSFSLFPDCFLLASTSTCMPYLWLAGIRLLLVNIWYLTVLRAYMWLMSVQVGKQILFVARFMIYFSTRVYTAFYLGIQFHKNLTRCFSI